MLAFSVPSLEASGQSAGALEKRIGVLPDRCGEADLGGAAGLKAIGEGGVYPHPLRQGDQACL